MITKGIDHHHRHEPNHPYQTRDSGVWEASAPGVSFRGARGQDRVHTEVQYNHHHEYHSMLLIIIISILMLTMMCSFRSHRFDDDNYGSQGSEYMLMSSPSSSSPSSPSPSLS